MISELVACVKTAGIDYLLPLLNKVKRRKKLDNSIVTAADLAVDKYISQFLSQRWPEITLLSEEMSADTRARQFKLDTVKMWCLDPLDGTTNFAAGAPYFAISLALINKNRSELAIVYDPVRDECFTAVRDQGAQLNGEPIVNINLPTQLSQAIANIDFKRLDDERIQQVITNPVYYSQRNYGACALEFCWLATGRIHLYLHGGMKLWDYAAGSLILTEAGGAHCTLEGGPIFNTESHKSSVVAASSVTLFDQWKNYLVS